MTFMPDRNGKITVARMVHIAAIVWRVEEHEITGARRLPHLIRPRFAVCAEASKQGWSYSHIGRVLGGRDHSSISYATQKISVFRQYEEEFEQRYTRFRRWCRPELKPHPEQIQPPKALNEWGLEC